MQSAPKEKSVIDTALSSFKSVGRMSESDQERVYHNQDRKNALLIERYEKMKLEKEMQDLMKRNI